MAMSLRNRIILFFLCLLIISTLATIGSVLIATNTSVKKQAQEKLNVGKNVFEQLMIERGNQLLSSARVLVADFGFKDAVTSNDAATITSALENNQDRIEADLMILLNLEGDVITNTLGVNISDRIFESLLNEARQQGGAFGIIFINNAIYQLVMLPVKAPIPLAWSMVAKRIDKNFAQQLKNLTDLDVEFLAQGKNDDVVFVSTLNNAMQENQVLEEDTNFHILEDQNQQFLSLTVPLSQSDYFQIEAKLHTSLSRAYSTFSPLKIQIITIASITLILSMLIAIWIARNITQPIRYLAKAAARISSGDYQHTIQTLKGASLEITDLSQSFETMQQGIALREEKLSNLAYSDSLTGVDNRTALLIQLNERLVHNPQQPFAIVRVFIHHFKEVNDTFGYEMGDELLKTFGFVLTSYANDTHKVARLNAAEFALTLNNIDENTIMNELLHLQSILQHPLSINDIHIKSHIIMGVVFYPKQGNEAEQLLRRGEIALNHAKDHALDYAYYQEGQDERHLRKITLVNDLKEDLEQDRLLVHFQAKVDLDKHKVTQVEALLRWTHDEYGFISPEEFINLAEQTGLMPALTEWMLNQVFNQAIAWQRAGLDITIAVNLSAFDLVNDFPRKVESLLLRHNLSPQRIMLEITESAVMDNPDVAIDVLHKLKRIGFTLSIDDYGTGYSSLSQLKNMPVNELKIDKSFVLSLENDENDQAIVKSTIELAHNIGLNVVAEGVETLAAFAMLKQWGCNKLQGYFISRPISAADFEVWLAQYQVPEVSP